MYLPSSFVLATKGPTTELGSDQLPDLPFNWTDTYT